MGVRFLNIGLYFTYMGFETPKADSSERNENELTELIARRSALKDRIDGIKKTLDEGDQKFAGKTVTEAERKIRSEILTEDLANLRRAEEMLKFIDDEIGDAEQSENVNPNAEPWNDVSYRNGDNRGAAAN